jgi:hypothetical protein
MAVVPLPDSLQRARCPEATFSRVSTPRRNVPRQDGESYVPSYGPVSHPNTRINQLRNASKSRLIYVPSNRVQRLPDQPVSRFAENKHGHPGSIKDAYGYARFGIRRPVDAALTGGCFPVGKFMRSLRRPCYRGERVLGALIQFPGNEHNMRGPRGRANSGRKASGCDNSKFKLYRCLRAETGLLPDAAAATSWLLWSVVFARSSSVRSRSGRVLRAAGFVLHRFGPADAKHMLRLPERRCGIDLGL